MSTSVREIWLKQALRQLYAALFFALLGAIYERFSHEVYSYYMIYAFALPLVLGVLPYALFALRGRALPDRMALCFWDSGILTLTVGSVFKGVLDIYGTTNWLWGVYPVAGAVLLLSGIVFGAMNDGKQKE